MRGDEPRHPRRLDEQGSAIVEFLTLGVLLLVPLIYLVLTVARIQAGAYAVSMAAREAGRAFVTATDEGSAFARADSAATIALDDHHFSRGEAEVTITCSTAPCLTPGGTVRVETRVLVPLPLIPVFARDVLPLEVPVTADAVATVDSYRATP